MPLDADAIAARRQLKRQLGLWRFAAVLLVVVLLVASVVTVQVVERDRIAVIPVHGVLYGDPRILEALERVEEDRAVKAVILDIDSPGGAVVPSEEIFEAVRRVSAAKPVVATMRSVAASGGYIVALAADRVFARRNTITGSIGVIFQNVELSKLMDTVGVKVDEITSGPLKAEPSMYRPMSEEGRAAITALIGDTFDWFVNLVVERRGLGREEALKLADGRVFTGTQALASRLVDGLGGQEEAVAWLAEAHGIDRDLPLSPVALEMLEFDLVDLMAGLPARAVRKALQSEPLTLDGLVALWHPRSE